MKLEKVSLFSEYNCYLITNKENRKIVVLYNPFTQKSKCISYARYLVSIKENRILSSDEQVDHIDEDKTNDDISNLQILSARDNKDKHYRLKGKTRYLKLICPMCNKEFDIEYRNSFSRKNSKFHCCSKLCLHNFLKEGPFNSEELIEVGKNQIVYEFYMNKKTGVVLDGFEE